MVNNASDWLEAVFSIDLEAVYPGVGHSLTEQRIPKVGLDGVIIF
jgi:hypothetical protein